MTNLGSARVRIVPDPPQVDVHATGVLSDLQAIARALNPWWLRSSPWPTWWPRHPDAEFIVTARAGGLAQHWRRHALRSRGQHLLRNVRRRKAWHGYHAEPRVMPEGLQRIGTGWTRRRALANLQDHIDRAGAPRVRKLREHWWRDVWVPAARDSLRRRRHQVGSRWWPIRVLIARAVACRQPEPDVRSMLGRWRCQRRWQHGGAHRFRNYVWSDGADRSHYDPMPVHGHGVVTW